MMYIKDLSYLFGVRTLNYIQLRVERSRNGLDQGQITKSGFSSIIDNNKKNPQTWPWLLSFSIIIKPVKT